MYKEKKYLLSLLILLFLAISESSASAVTHSSRVSHSRTASERPSPTSSNGAKPTLSPAQESAIKTAKESYLATIKQAREGAIRAVADAKSLLEQELAAAGKDKELKANAVVNYKKNVAAIWAAFKKTETEAKTTLRSTLNSISHL